jgi:hypothetical protein
MDTSRLQASFTKRSDFSVSGNVGRGKDPIVLDGDEGALEADGTAKWALTLLDASARRIDGQPHERFGLTGEYVAHCFL